MQMVGTQGEYHVSRTAGNTEHSSSSSSHDGSHHHKHSHLRNRLQKSAHTLALHTSFILHGGHALAQAIRSFTGHHASHHEPSNHGAAAGQQAEGAGGSKHAVVTVAAASGGTDSSDSSPTASSARQQRGGWRRWLGWWHTSPSAQQPPLRSKTKEVNTWIAPPVFGPMHVKSGASTTLLHDSHHEEADEDYTINPRLTLVFKDVWVADIPIQEGLLHKARRKIERLCCGRRALPAGADCADSSSRGDWSTGSGGNKPSCEQYESDLARCASLYITLLGQLMCIPAAGVCSLSKLHLAFLLCIHVGFLASHPQHKQQTDTHWHRPCPPLLQCFLVSVSCPAGWRLQLHRVLTSLCLASAAALHTLRCTQSWGHLAAGEIICVCDCKLVAFCLNEPPVTALCTPCACHAPATTLRCCECWPSLRSYSN